MQIENPVLIAARGRDGGLVVHFYKDQMTQVGYEALIARLVDHVAECLDVPKDIIWSGVQRERHSPSFGLLASN